MTKYIAIIVLSLAISGCGGLLSNLGSLATKDVNAAHTSALAWNDPLAAQCWGWLISVIPSTGPTKVIGFATGYQKGRNIRRTIQIRDTDAFKINCGPMIMDSRSVLGRIFPGL